MIFPNDDEVFRFDYKIDYGLLLVQAGLFPSIKDAHRHNYAGEVPLGWNDFMIQGTRVYIYNPSEVRWATENLPPWDDILDPCNPGFMPLI